MCYVFSYIHGNLKCNWESKLYIFQAMNVYKGNESEAPRTLDLITE
jgi:hypothetical protein